ERIWRVWQERFAWLAPHWIVYGFVGGVMAIAYHAAGLYALAVFAVPLLLMRKTQEAYLRHTQRSAQKLRQAAETIQSQNVSLEQANRLLKERSTAAMESLSATVDARDAYTAGHSRRVQQLALGARIIHVADALDSMLTTRIYRAARPAMEAMEELKRAAGTQFCPRCVAALNRVLPPEILADESARHELLAAS